jgi:proteasome accessory factor A
LFGIETEYAVGGCSAEGMTIDPAHVAFAMLDLARARVAHLAGPRDDLFLQNGGRFYIDCGGHPEFATPECLDPGDAVRYVRAGDRLMAMLADTIERHWWPGARVSVFRSNVDYSNAHATWGCHESYLYRGARANLASSLLPHLISRVVFTGAGGLAMTHEGPRFTLSPRAAFFAAIDSTDSVWNRGILNGRDEPLASLPYRRLHVTFGESLASDTALWLKIGTTALVVALADHGLNPGAAVALESPVEALRTVAADPLCQARLRLANGRLVTAVEIQRHLCDQAYAHRHKRFMPAWTGIVCRRWRQILDKLAGAPESVSRELDWAIKYTLFTDRTRRAGHPGALAPDYHPGKPADITGLVRLGHELAEIDLHFAELGPASIFRALDREGLLRHAVDSIGEAEIQHAVLRPPAAGRAHLRGRAVRRLGSEGRPTRATGGWTAVYDRLTGRRLDLSNPFEQKERWLATPATKPQAGPR